jgi:EpsI family protein
VRKSFLILSIVLMAQAGVFYGFSRHELIPKHTPLNTFPKQLGDWRMLQEAALDPDIEAILRADDTLSRWYGRPFRMAVQLYVAFFESQRYGKEPHSPKNCLPGSGWIPIVSDRIRIQVPGRAEPITANRYIVAMGEKRSVVMYWYQSRDRVVASEYAARAYAVVDALRYNRSDTSLVRVIVDVREGDEREATETGIEFVKTFFSTLRGFLPA